MDALEPMTVLHTQRTGFEPALILLCQNCVRTDMLEPAKLLIATAGSRDNGASGNGAGPTGAGVRGRVRAECN